MSNRFEFDDLRSMGRGSNCNRKKMSLQRGELGSNLTGVSRAKALSLRLSLLVCKKSESTTVLSRGLSEIIQAGHMIP